MIGVRQYSVLVKFDRLRQSQTLTLGLKTVRGIRATASHHQRQPKGEQFTILLPKGTTPDQTEDELYQMALTAVEAYVIRKEPAIPTRSGRAGEDPRIPAKSERSGRAGEDPRIPTRAENMGEDPIIPGPSDDQQTVGIDHDDEIRVEELLPQNPETIDVTDLRRLQTEDSGLQVIVNALRARQQTDLKVELSDRPQGGTDMTRDYLLDEREVLMHVEPFETTARRVIRQQIVVPTLLRERIMYLHHGSATAAHMGLTRTYVEIRDRYYWVGMKEEIRRYVLSCHCQGIKRRAQENNFIAEQALQASWPNDLVVIDCAGPLPASAQGNRYLILIQDVFTRYMEVIAVPRINSETLARVIFFEWIRRYVVARELRLSI